MNASEFRTCCPCLQFVDILHVSCLFDGDGSSAEIVKYFYRLNCYYFESSLTHVLRYGSNQIFFRTIYFANMIISIFISVSRTNLFSIRCVVAHDEYAKTWNYYPRAGKIMNYKNQAETHFMECACENEFTLLLKCDKCKNKSPSNLQLWTRSLPGINLVTIIISLIYYVYREIYIQKIVRCCNSL